MSNLVTKNKTDIDAVITWVDGNSSKQILKRQKYLSNAINPLHENAVNPHRWMCNNEILYCLQSIYNFAPWIKKIWIVVDDEVPDVSSLSPEIQQKITYVYHREIFRELSDNLPTFNSLSIESLLWRIDGLSEKFVYFNDDVFLTAPLQPTDLFQGKLTVLRGKWVDYSSIVGDEKCKQDPALFNHYMHINAAEVLDFRANNIFEAAHVAHPFKRSKMCELFSSYKTLFLGNTTYRFRDLNQFLPQALYNHACIQDKTAIFNKTQDHLHIYSGQEKDSSYEEIKNLLTEISDNHIKFLCINDLPKLETLVPDLRNWITKIVGGSDNPMG